jgi:hypothetical protein
MPLTSPSGQLIAEVPRFRSSTGQVRAALRIAICARALAERGLLVELQPLEPATTAIRACWATR